MVQAGTFDAHPRTKIKQLPSGPLGGDLWSHGASKGALNHPHPTCKVEWSLVESFVLTHVYLVLLTEIKHGKKAPSLSANSTKPEKPR